ncbi:hypothetical protein D0T53_02950 [Dysgonomonas sp. 216]|uniref:hypothetical protein n=1 Tax=Dysgonomonas sp. 216 TaxID=2302934 RepID=UPI0013D22A0A|nr:hypothetical protein [Dysgonomonas sp. 216]NDW17875.1 hypothetical protein [Dysgonomonas sp. 216]
MNYNLDIQKILLEVDKQVNPNDKLVLLKRAINIADANNDIDWGFDLRLHLIHCEQHTSRSEERFPAFTWILNVFDSTPDYFSEHDIEVILAEYQWMAFEVYRNADISRDQINAVFNDFARRLEQNGYTMRVYYSIMSGWHLFLGEIDEAEKYIELRDSLPRDVFYYESELIEKVCVELVRGNFDKAIALAHKQIIPNANNSEARIDSISMLCTLIYYLSKAGDKRADTFFYQIDEEIKKLPHLFPFSLNTFALLMHHMAIADPEKAWSYFPLCTEWAIGARDLISFEFSLNLLPLLKQGGTRKLNLNSNLPYYRTDGIYNVDELYEYYLNLTLSYVSRFDARNGSAHFKEQFDEVFDMI